MLKILILLLTLSACGQEGFVQMNPKENDLTTAADQRGKQKKKELKPIKFTSYTHENAFLFVDAAQTGEYRIPSEVKVDFATGNHLLQLTIGKMNYCYRGDGSYESYKLVDKKRQSGYDCRNSTGSTQLFDETWKVKKNDKMYLRWRYVDCPGYCGDGLIELELKGVEDGK